MNLRKSILAVCTLFIGAITAFGEIPQGYYTSCEGKSKAALKSQLYTIVKDHKAIPYGSGSGETWSAFHYTDIAPDGNYWLDIYTTNQVGVTSGAASGMNIEHTFPKSWWGGGKNDAYKDVVHLMPTNSIANSTRGNWPYAEVATPKSISNKCTNPRFQHGTPKSGQGGGAGTVFEPDDEFKGDLARTYFYMVTCYQNLSWSSDGLRTAAQGSYPTLQPWAIEMLLRWHREDPVSSKEIARNEGVYQCQGNRNPFIDYPEMAEHIWGNLQEQGWHAGETPGPVGPIDPDPPVTDDAVLTSPTAGSEYDFGDVALGENRIMEIPVLGKNFTHALTARLQGEFAGQFSFMVGNMSLPAISIMKTDINDSEGYFLKVRYAPTQYTGTDVECTAQIEISSPDLKEPVIVTVKGTSEAPFDVEVPVALDAEDITDEGYTAHWMRTTQDVDYYTIYRDIYDETGTEIVLTEDYDVSGAADSFYCDSRISDLKERYCVTATVRGKESAKSNYIVIEPRTGITAVDTDNAEAVYITPDGIVLHSIPADGGVYIVKRGNKVTRRIMMH